MVAGIFFLEHYGHIYRHFSHANCLSMNFKNQFSVICHRPHSRIRGKGQALEPRSPRAPPTVCRILGQSASVCQGLVFTLSVSDISGETDLHSCLAGVRGCELCVCVCRGGDTHFCDWILKSSFFFSPFRGCIQHSLWNSKSSEVT